MDLFKRLEDERLAAEGLAQASPPASAPGVPPGDPHAEGSTSKPLPAEPFRPAQPATESAKVEAK